jgi:hypothetical protein
MIVVEEVLAAWRDAERLLDELPPVGNDHETVVLVVASLRDTYARITNDAIRTSPTVIAETRDTIQSSRELLARVHSKLDGGATY